MFRWPVRVYYEDTDAGGVVYHANYLKFFERARTEMLRDLGWEQDALAREHQIIFVVRALHIDYLLPARFNDRLEVHSTLDALKSASMQFAQNLMRDETSLCQATVRIACLDRQNWRPKIIPAALMESFKAYVR